MFQRILLLLCLLTAMILSACSGVSKQAVNIPWQYNDLILLDPADAAEPSQDILAVYIRSLGKEVQFRVDLLDHGILPDYDLYLLIDSHPGGALDLPLDAEPAIAWDTLVVIPARGKLQVLTPEMTNKGRSGLQVMRDPVLDTLTISLNRDVITGPAENRSSIPNIKLQAFLTPAGSKQISDSISPVHSQSQPPNPANILFVFWNSLPAASPGLALRRWDGAHTGPYGGRHGLFNLLRTARASQIPLVLLDLKAPASLSALEYIGETEMVRSMHARGLLVLPEYIPDLPANEGMVANGIATQILENNRNVALEFGLPTSQFLSTSTNLLPPQSGTRFTFLRTPSERAGALASEPVNVERWRDQLVLRIPGYPGAPMPPQATHQGPTLALRRALVNAALSREGNGQMTEALVLGGDLPASDFGAPQAARATFKYINAHPWMRVLDANALISAQSSERFEPVPVQDDPASIEINKLFVTLLQGSDSPITKAAWQSLQSIYGPLYPFTPELPMLRKNYLSVVWSLLAAAEWGNNPKDITNCSDDPDGDGEPECILASNNLYTQFEIESGTLSYAFALLGEPDGTLSIHQIMAPSAQFIAGLSDPITWDLTAGLAADPMVITGAFADNSGHFQAVISGGSIKFRDPDTGTQKVFSLEQNSINVDLITKGDQSINWTIPLALDPWVRFSPGWPDNYAEFSEGNTWSWSLVNGLRVNIQGIQDAAAYTFLNSRSLMIAPENPNRDYGPGHFLPFPMALVKNGLMGNFSIEIEIDAMAR